MIRLGVVAHTCNSSTLGDQGSQITRTAWHLPEEDFQQGLVCFASSRSFLKHLQRYFSHGIRLSDAEVFFPSGTKSQQNRYTFSQDVSPAELFPVSKALAFFIISSAYEQDTVLSYIPLQL
ncbi:hypothetical protein AAY473_026524 [Plecturocebus cupreus]